MKPIRLKIKGLNSFLEPQEIDFQTLAKDGLFGIFGPTGSGKSTLLDGITLALYGTTARNSSNYIHVSTDKAFVEYLFSVKEKAETLYRVTRSFKRSKEGSIRSDSARLTRLSEEGEQVLADRVGTVNELCRSIIGLNKDDFFRTVVLPQGKFSEFLKLEGKQRNEMLERLFGLEKYGQQLAELIKKQEASWEGRRREKEGALSRYAGVTREQLRELKRQEKSLEKMLKQENSSLENLRADLEKLRQLLADQETLKKLEEKEQRLSIQKKEIQALEEVLADAKRADKLWEAVLAKQEAEKRQNEIQEKLSSLVKEAADKETLEAQYTAMQEQSQKELKTRLPLLQKRKEALEEAERILQEIRQLNEQKQQFAMEKAALQQQLAQTKEALEENQQQKEAGQAKRASLGKSLQQISVSAQQQAQIQEGFRIQKDLDDLTKRTQAEQERFTHLRLQAAHAKEQWETCQKQAEAFRTEALQAGGQLQKLQEQQSRFLGLDEKKEFLFAVRAEQEKEQQLCSQEKTCLQNYEMIKEALAAARRQAEQAQQQKDQAQSLYREHLALFLLDGLKPGEPCPVCGSTHHVKSPQKSHLESRKKLEEAQKTAELHYQQQAEKAAQLQAKAEAEEENHKRILAEKTRLDPALLKEDPQKLLHAYETLCQEKQQLEKETEDWRAREREKEKQAQDFHTQAVRRQTEADGYEKQAETAKEQLSALIKAEQEKNAQKKALTAACGISDFSKAYEELIQNNQLSEKLRKEQDALLSQLEDLEAKSQKLFQEKSSQTQLFQEKTFRTEELCRQLERCQERYQDTAGDLSAEEIAPACRQVISSMEALERQAEQAEKALRLAAKAAADLRVEKGRLEAVAEETVKDCSRKKEHLREQMQEQQIQEESWILAHRKSQEEQTAAADKIQQFGQQMLQIQAEKKAVEKNLDEKRTDQEEVTVLTGQEQTLAEQIRLHSLQLGAVTKEREQMAGDWKEKEALTEELEQILHKLDLLKELDGLFKGKRFVEFVSRYYLDYISREADACLKNMTGNGYGMETDGSGMFVIRDYKNGGAVRSASTLSGGETFMASLALALALSSGIQMKGAAPMELFFLDEGFGTLDETCLDIVMEALEKVRTRKRSVGIITHVEEIKSRIPVRLIVEPARTGEGGSRVHIEHL